jgi:hypothetical protein
MPKVGKLVVVCPIDWLCYIHLASVLAGEHDQGLAGGDLQRVKNQA